MRVALDANVVVSALLSPTGPPARLIAAWRNGELELVLCPALIAEIEAVLARPRITARVDALEASEFVETLRERAEVVPDPTAPPPIRTDDPDDDYLIALAARERIVIVSGDAHVLALADRIPVRSPREFLEELRP